MYGHGEGLFHAPYTWPKKEKAQPPKFFFIKEIQVENTLFT